MPVTRGNVSAGRETDADGAMPRSTDERHVPFDEEETLWHGVRDEIISTSDLHDDGKLRITGDNTCAAPPPAPPTPDPPTTLAPPKPDDAITIAALREALAGSRTYERRLEAAVSQMAYRLCRQAREERDHPADRLLYSVVEQLSAALREQRRVLEVASTSLA